VGQVASILAVRSRALTEPPNEDNRSYRAHRAPRQKSNQLWRMVVEKRGLFVSRDFSNLELTYLHRGMWFWEAARHPARH